MKRLGFLPQKKENCTTRAKPSLTRAELAWPMLNREWPVPICTPRAENKLDTPRAKAFQDPCKPNEQHGPCWAARPVQLWKSAHTPRGHARPGDSCWAKTTNTVRAADPCRTTFSLARSVQLTRVRKVGFACLTCTVRVEDPCSSFPSASWSFAHSWTQLFTQNSTATSPKPNHCQNYSNSSINSL